MRNTIKKPVNCNQCKKTYFVHVYKLRSTKYCSNSCKWKSKLGKSRPDISNENHYLWKGDSASIDAIHHWIANRIVKKKCEGCGTKSNLHYANKSGKYKRDLRDWLILCVKCHSNFDKSWKVRIRDKLGRFKGTIEGYVSPYNSAPLKEEKYKK